MRTDKVDARAAPQAFLKRVSVTPERLRASSKAEQRPIPDLAGLADPVIAPQVAREIMELHSRLAANRESLQPIASQHIPDHYRNYPGFAPIDSVIGELSDAAIELLRAYGSGVVHAAQLSGEARAAASLRTSSRASLYYAGEDEPGVSGVERATSVIDAAFELATSESALDDATSASVTAHDLLTRAEWQIEELAPDARGQLLGRKAARDALTSGALLVHSLTTGGPRTYREAATGMPLQRDPVRSTLSEAAMSATRAYVEALAQAKGIQPLC